MDNVKKFDHIATAVYVAWLQKWLFVRCVFRRYRSGNITSILFRFLLICCSFLPAKYGTIPYSLLLTPIAALLQAVLQSNTEPLRNGLVETRNWTVEATRNHSTGLKRSQMMMEYGLRSRNINFVLIHIIRRIVINIFQF